MDKSIIIDYYKSVCEAYRLGNVESSYNAPIITLFERFGCAARDLSGERKGQTGENIDIKLWHSEEEISETEPFAGIEVKKVGGIDKRALSQIKTEADRYGNAILTAMLKKDIDKINVELNHIFCVNQEARVVINSYSDYIREIKKMKACTFAAYNEIDELWNRADRQFEKYARSNKKRLIKQILTDRFLIILCIIILLIIVTAAITQIFGI